MMKTTIISNKSRRDLAHSAVETIAESVKRILSQKGRVVMAIPGGRSVAEIFDEFKTTALIPWDKIHIFMADERLVESNSHDSNYRNACELFLSKLLEDKKIPAKNIHPFKYDISAKDKGLRQYNEEFRKFKKFDIVILGSGEDGHIAAVFPEHHSIKQEGNEYFVMYDSPKPPKERMTSTKNMIENADTAIVLFLGEGKKQALRNFKDPKLSIIQCPAKTINEAAHPYAFTDNLT